VRDFLINGSQPRWTTRSANEMAEHWARRWARPRAARDDAWREFDRRSWRLYGPGTGDG
jgi:hypothetical protein